MRLPSVLALGLLGCTPAGGPASATAAMDAPESAAPAPATLAQTPPRVGAPGTTAATDPAARLVAETLTLPVRGGLTYWGITPPADCIARSATDASLRFLCTARLEALARYFRYYYPALRVETQPGGLSLGGAAEQATAHVVELPAGDAAAQLLLHRPLGAVGRDEVAEALLTRLLARP